MPVTWRSWGREEEAPDGTEGEIGRERWRKLMMRQGAGVRVEVVVAEAAAAVSSGCPVCDESPKEKMDERPRQAEEGEKVMMIIEIGKL